MMEAVTMHQHAELSLAPPRRVGTLVNWRVIIYLLLLLLAAALIHADWQRPTVAPGQYQDVPATD
jgi:hypothetical protein